MINTNKMCFFFYSKLIHSDRKYKLEKKLESTQEIFGTQSYRLKPNVYASTGDLVAEVQNLSAKL